MSDDTDGKAGRTSARDIPPEAGKRASIDSRTGEVHGSGTGAGGGTGGEDYDSDAAAGSREETPGGLPQEAVEDRPNVSTVKPEDYPHQQ